MDKNYSQLSVWVRNLMFLSYVAVLLAFTLSTLIVPSCNRLPNPVIWLLHCLPLLAFLPAMLRQNVRAHAWLCFVLLFYFLTSVPVAFACTDVVTVFEVSAVVVLFVATMLYIRWRSRALKQLGVTVDESNPK